MSLLVSLRNLCRRPSPSMAPLLAATPPLAQTAPVKPISDDPVWKAWRNYQRGWPQGDWHHFLAVLAFHRDGLAEEAADLQRQFDQANSIKPFDP